MQLWLYSARGTVNLGIRMTTDIRFGYRNLNRFYRLTLLVLERIKTYENLDYDKISEQILNQSHRLEARLFILEDYVHNGKGLYPSNEINQTLDDALTLRQAICEKLNQLKPLIKSHHENNTFDAGRLLKQIDKLTQIVDKAGVTPTHQHRQG